MSVCGCDVRSPFLRGASISGDVGRGKSGGSAGGSTGISLACVGGRIFRLHYPCRDNRARRAMFCGASESVMPGCAGCCRFFSMGGGWCVAPCSVEFMRKKSDMTDGFGPWTGHVLKMYRREVQDDCLVVFTVGLIFVPLLVLSVFMPFWAAKIWVEGIDGEFAFNAVVALLIALVVSVPATIILGAMFIRQSSWCCGLGVRGMGCVVLWMRAGRLRR